MKKHLALAIILIAISCTTSTPPTTRQPDNLTTANKAAFGANGFDLTGMDTSVKPCDDFYKFAVGKWRENNPLKPEYARYGRFEQVAERNRDVLRQILE